MLEKIIEKAKAENKKVYIYAHKFPDGDAISSSRAVAEYLKLHGVDAKYIVTNDIIKSDSNPYKIAATADVDPNQISIILDTSTVSYAENTLFKKSTPDNTYVIDHHGKIGDSICTEDELNLPTENVIRNSNASSACEIVLNDMQKDRITPQIANMLTFGLLTDTDKLKFLKSETLQNLSKLIGLGANYEKISQYCNSKTGLRGAVGIAKALLRTKKFKIGDTFGTILGLDNSEVQELNANYGITSPQKKISKMLNIENCSFNCMYAENKIGEYNLEFRSTPIYGNFDVLKLALSHNGGGHYNASGCPIKTSDAYTKSDIEVEIINQSVDMYSEKATNLQPIALSEQDLELKELLDKTRKLSEGVTPAILSKVDSLVKSGANYNYVSKSFKTFTKFMLENEILSKIPMEVCNEKNPNVSINLSAEDVSLLKQKYHVEDDEILAIISTFLNMRVGSATILLPNGKKSTLDDQGNISVGQQCKKDDFTLEQS